MDRPWLRSAMGKNSGWRWRQRPWSLPAHDSERPRPCKRRGREKVQLHAERLLRVGIEAFPGPIDEPAPLDQVASKLPTTRSSRRRMPSRSTPRPAPGRSRGGARGRIRWASPAPRSTRSRNAARFRLTSTSVILTSGWAIASGMPGSPAPEPMSQEVDTPTRNGTARRQSRMWRSRSLGASFFAIIPIGMATRPRSPSYASSDATCLASRVRPGCSAISQPSCFT